ncbi:MAG: hypothetical protein ACLFSA_12215, partial [Spirochaetaceae bacterium]
MGEPKMELGEREFEKIGDYVKSHLPQWLEETGGESAAALHRRELDILERVVRVEDELKNLREVMEERFEAQQKQIDQRFNHVEKRFDAMQTQMNERFDAMQTQMNERFEAQQKQIDERFEAQQKQIDRRFEAVQTQLDTRFDAMDKRFSFNQRILGIGFTAIALLIVVLNYLG